MFYKYIWLIDWLIESRSNRSCSHRFSLYVVGILLLMWSGAAGKARYQFGLERSNEYRIKQTILRRAHYDHTTRPVRDDKTAVNVLVAISLYHILDTVGVFPARSLHL